MEAENPKWTEGSKAERRQEFDKGKNNDESEGENDSKEQETMMDEMKLEQDDLKAKFERFEQLSITKIPKYSKKEKRLQPPELLNQEEIDKIYNDFNIEFDPNAVSKTIKRGREELDAKKGEYAKKKQDLETFEISLREDKNDIHQKTESHQKQVGCALELESELNQDLSEIINQQVICETDKENFASKYVQLKSEKRKYEERKSKLNLQIAKEEAIVETYNDVLLFRSQKTESKYNQNEESTEHLDSIANSIAINSTEVQNCCGDVKTAISDLVKNKNDEIQQVKKFSDEENKCISKNTELFNSTIDSTKTYLKLIDQIANNIKSKVKECKDNQISKKIETTYDFSKNILEPLGDIGLQFVKYQQPQIIYTNIDKAKQLQESELKMLADAQNQLGLLMTLGGKNSQLKCSMQEKLNQLETQKKIIKDRRIEINEWDKELKIKEQEKVTLEDEINKIENTIIAIRNKNFTQFCKSVNFQITERDKKNQIKNNIQFDSKEILCSQLIKENSILEDLHTQLKIEMQKDCSKILKILVEYICYTTINKKEEKSEFFDKIKFKVSKKLYYSLNHFLSNEKSSSEVNYYWETFISIEDASKFFKKLEPILKEIEDSEEYKRTDQSHQEGDFDSKFYRPLKELLKCKVIQAEIQKQRLIVDRIKNKFLEYKLNEIDSFEIIPEDNQLENETDKFITYKQSKDKELVQLMLKIKELQLNIGNAQSEIKAQTDNWNTINQEYKNLENDQNQINTQMEEIITKIINYILTKFEDKSLRKKVYAELCKINEGDFETENINSCFNQICTELIMTVDEFYKQSIDQYTSEWTKYDTIVNQKHISQFNEYKKDTCKIIEQGLQNMDQVSQNNIENFADLLQQIDCNMNTIHNSISNIQEQNKLVWDSIKKESEIFMNVNQNFDNVHNKLISIDDIVDEAPWKRLSKSDSK